MSKLSYKTAGVDLDQYGDAMARLPRLMHRTFSPRVMKLDGGFAGLFQLDFASRLFARRYDEPVLIACTDGVGTKLQVAGMAGRHDTVGIDLVAMCVNDAACCGGEALFFLDYVAMSRDNPPLLEHIVQGISDGCLEADCALLGGETAIMPGLYREDDYDLAGFCVGVVDRRNLIDGSAISAGDVVLGVASSGVHSNGFSLIRKIVFEHAKLTVDAPVHELGRTVGAELLEPTRIYARSLRTVMEHYKKKSVVHGIAHITGGGLHENLQRIMPVGTRAVIQRDSWDVPAVFPWLRRLGEVDDDEMQRVFNMGIGLVLVVSAYYANHIQKLFGELDLPSWQIGRIVEGPGDVTWNCG